MRDENDFAASGPFTDETWRRFYSGDTLPSSPSPEPSEGDELKSDHSINSTPDEEPNSQPQTDASAQTETVSGPTRRKWILPPKGNQANPTRPKQKYVPSSRVLFMSDTGTTHTMKLHESARYFGTPSSPNWLTPKAVNNVRGSDFHNYVAIPLTAEGVSSSRHTSPPTCRDEFDVIWEGAMERQGQDPIVPECWPERWESSTWTSTV